MPKKLLICGATGFIGRNLLERFRRDRRYAVTAVWRRRRPPRELLRGAGVRWLRADLTRAQDAARAVAGQDVVLQAAATTSGARDIVERPFLHATDNAVMNSLLFRAAHEAGTGRVVFLSCAVMYAPRRRPVREEDFDHRITARYFGAGWTKVYLEKMCEFYARLGRTRYTVIRHSNVYGPHDKFDLEKSHVLGATVAKVLAAKDKVVVWGGGRERRDLLYVDDLTEFVEAALRRQRTPFELVNVGLGRSISVLELVRRVIALSGKRLRIEFDRGRPTIPFSLALDCGRARRVFGWRPRTTLDEGLRRTLDWCSQGRNLAKSRAAR